MSVRAQFVRFLATGASNTVASYAVYLALLPFVHYLVAYTIAYLFGIGLSYALMTRFVFQTTARWSTALRFPLVYVVQYLLGSSIIHVLVAYAGVRPFLAALLAMIVTVPATFVLARVVFRR